jgi:hypothetical protein
VKKTLPNGEVIEGTPAELAEYERTLQQSQAPPLIAQEPPRPKPAADQAPKARPPIVATTASGTAWKPHEDAIIEQMYRSLWAKERLQAHAVATIAKMLPGRTEQAVVGRASFLRVSERIMKERYERARAKGQKPLTAVIAPPTPPPPPPSSPPVPKESTTDKKEELNKALHELTEKNKPKPHVIVDEAEVYMHTLIPQDQELFLDIVRDMIANQTRLSFLTHGKRLGIDRGWDWARFIEEFQDKKAKLAQYFNVPDYFEFRKFKDKYHEMTYHRPPRPSLS